MLLNNFHTKSLNHINPGSDNSGWVQSFYSLLEILLVDGVGYEPLIFTHRQFFLSHDKITRQQLGEALTFSENERRKTLFLYLLGYFLAYPCYTFTFISLERWRGFPSLRIVWSRAIVGGVSNPDSTILKILEILKILLQTIPGNRQRVSNTICKSCRYRGSYLGYRFIRYDQIGR